MLTIAQMTALSITLLCAETNIDAQPQAGPADHLYTTSLLERDQAIKYYGYTAEGVTCYVSATPVQGGLTLWRLSRNGQHLYTTSTEERDSAIKDYGYKLESMPAYIVRNQTQETVPLYRVDRISDVGRDDRLYTTSQVERDKAVNGYWDARPGHHDFKYGGITAYVSTSPLPGTVPLYRLSRSPSSRWNDSPSGIAGPSKAPPPDCTGVTEIAVTNQSTDELVIWLSVDGTWKDDGHAKVQQTLKIPTPDGHLYGPLRGIDVVWVADHNSASHANSSSSEWLDADSSDQTHGAVYNSNYAMFEDPGIAPGCSKSNIGILYNVTGVGTDVSYYQPSPSATRDAGAASRRLKNNSRPR